MTSSAGDDENKGIRQHGTRHMAAGRDFTIGGVNLNLVARLGAGWLPLAVSLALIGYAASVWPGGPGRQYVLFLLLTVPAVGCALACRVVGGGSPRHAFLTVTSLLCCIGAFASLQYVIRTGEVPVKIRISGTQPLRGRAPDPLTLVMRAPAEDKTRDRLRLQLTVVDNDSATGTCVHKTRFTVTSETSGVTPRTHEARKATDTLEWDLRGHTDDVRLTFALHSEDRCAMRLDAVGTLHD